MRFSPLTLIVPPALAALLISTNASASAGPAGNGNVNSNYNYGGSYGGGYGNYQGHGYTYGYENSGGKDLRDERGQEGQWSAQQDQFHAEQQERDAAAASDAATPVVEPVPVPVADADADADADEAPPLPEGWSEHFDPNSGQYYYYNSLDGSTTWDRPEPPRASQEPQTSGVPSLAGRTENENRNVEDLRQDPYTASVSDSALRQNSNDASLVGQHHRPLDQSRRPNENDMNLNLDRDIHVDGQSPHMGHHQMQNSGRPENNQHDYDQRSTSTSTPSNNAGWMPPSRDSQYTNTNVHDQPSEGQRPHDIHQTRQQANNTHSGPNQNPSPNGSDIVSRPPPQRLPPSQFAPEVRLPPTNEIRHAPPDSTQNIGQRQQPPKQKTPPEAAMRHPAPSAGIAGWGTPNPKGQQPPPNSYRPPPSWGQRQQPHSSTSPPPVPDRQQQQQQQPPPHIVDERQQPLPHRQNQPISGSSYRSPNYVPRSNRPGHYGDMPPQYGQPQNNSPQQPPNQPLTRDIMSGNVMDAVGKSWQSLIGFGSKTKDAIGNARDSVSKSATAANQRFSSTATGFWGQAKNTLGSMFVDDNDNEPEPPTSSIQPYGTPRSPNVRPNPQQQLSGTGQPVRQGGDYSQQGPPYQPNNSVDYPSQERNRGGYNGEMGFQRYPAQHTQLEHQVPTPQSQYGGYTAHAADSRHPYWGAGVQRNQGPPQPQHGQYQPRQRQQPPTASNGSQNARPQPNTAPRRFE